MDFRNHSKAYFGLPLNGVFMGSLVTVILLMLVCRSLWAANTVLEFETQTLDLDTGTVSDTITFDISQDADVLVAYHATRPNHGALVSRNPAVGFALLTSMTYANATLADTVGLSYNSTLNSLPDSSATVIVLTDIGAVYKLGNFVEGTTSVNFDTQLLQ